MMGAVVDVGAIALLEHLPAMVFVFCFGACVGSFLNVVVYRLPAGMSVISPPSRCSTCGVRLRFFRENVPILGWFLVGGKCRTCGERVSAQYMIIEVIVALLFLGLYVILFTRPGAAWWGEIGGPWWRVNAFARAWPAYFALAFLLSALLAMTLIDARTFTIPIEIPNFVTGAAFILLPLQALLPRRDHFRQDWPFLGTDWPWALAAIGAMAGVCVAAVLLTTRRLPRSFADYAEYVKEGDALAVYPHARREMKWEILFLLPVMVGGVVGWWTARWTGLSGAPGEFLQALSGAFLGYLAGGAIVWGVRIAGTFGFGREAMGMGDVHLLAAVGAVLGPVEPLLIFFAAPFSGILWVAMAPILGRFVRVFHRQLPFGPHLAVATLLVMLGRPWIEKGFAWWGIPLPARGFVTASPAP